MGWLSSILIAFLTAGLGLVLAAFVASACVKWYRISAFEGGAGYFVVFSAFLGSIIAFLAGLVVSRVVAATTSASFPEGLGISALTATGLAGLVALGARLAADIPPTLNGRALELAVEVRGPKDFAAPEVNGHDAFACVHLDRRRHQPQAPLRLAEARQTDGRWVVPATVPLATSSSRKHLRAYFHAERDALFWLPLRAHPRQSDLEWSRWIESGWDARKPEPPPEAKFNMRYRVQPVEPPPPGPTVEQLAAEKAAAEQAAFDALGADTPIPAWFPHTRYGARDDRRAIAVRHIMARADHVAELAALMLDRDDDVAKDALYLVEHLPPPQPALVAPVTAAGRHIAEMIRTVNATSAEQDPAYLGAASVSVRFSAWMTAVRALRSHSGGDFTPELGVILELSRVRPESYAMRSDVCRVASYHMHEWAGVPPLPDDPPPR
jgi:hypothetical protein